MEKKIHEIHPWPKVFHSHYEPASLVGSEEEEEDLLSLKGKKILALSGIAHPHSFTSLLKKCDFEIVREALFPDHHLYTTKDLPLIKEKSRGVDCIVTTEKDMVKLKKLKIDSFPLRALRVEVKIWEEKEFYQRVMEIF